MRLTMEWAGTALAVLTDADLAPWPAREPSSG
jgi:hypothetical protein